MVSLTPNTVGVTSTTRRRLSSNKPVRLTPTETSPSRFPDLNASAISSNVFLWSDLKDTLHSLLGSIAGLLLPSSVTGHCVLRSKISWIVFARKWSSGVANLTSTLITATASAFNISRSAIQLSLLYANLSRAYLKSLQGCVSILIGRVDFACCVLEGLVQVLIVMFKLFVLVWVLRCVPGGFVFWQRSANLFIHGHYE